MAQSPTQSIAVASPPRRLPLFLAGFALFLLGPLLYVVQFQMDRLFIPWYAPALSTLGVLLMAISAWQRRSIVRGIGMAFFAVICVLQWLMLGVVMKTPAYTGPTKTGDKLPAFTAKLASGETIVNADLETNGPTILLFYRGDWCGICKAELRILEDAQADFAQRGVRIIAVSNDDLDTAKKTQTRYPHLTIVSDADQNIAKSLQVLHPGADPKGGDTNAPTTFLLDSAGKVRWLHRTSNVVERLSPDELLKAIDAKVR